MFFPNGQRCGFHHASHACHCPPFRVLTPIDGQTLESLTEIAGMGRPGATVTVRIDTSPIPAHVVVDGAGNWRVTNIAPLAEGSHWIYTTLRSTCCCASRNVPITIAPAPLAPPAVTSPTEGETVPVSTPTITGTGVPNALVLLCVAGAGCESTNADASGNFSHTLTMVLSNGPHILTASQADPATGQTSADAIRNFTVPNLTDSLGTTGSPLAATPPVPPTVAYPSNGMTINNHSPIITGTAFPGHLVTITLQGQETQSATAGSDGAYLLQFPGLLPSGLTVFTAFQTNPATDRQSDTFIGFFAIT